ncbi:FecR protein [Solidesulfovibrio carbinoliphilus subsp. oakridgensis]|uniref:FecR protein n=1 Tax=Solidesulfovibrio carbinoliphilus subsp. oakridgensis TaxID=694327 RepID=G7Q6J2_9BACT|nr:tetratricopeptide repeat protein [Solidesulfovibrio carbinoliphilus]EHJ47605.1 FecR protein [Solidesulfovibrio carbinoliphilus subsp. oakridgensis]
MPGIKAALLALQAMLLFLAMTGPALAAAEPVGRLLFVQGQVSLRPAGDAGWRPAEAGRTLFPGDALSTGPAAKAAVLCVDESQIKLNENTILVLKAAAPSGRLAGGGLVPAAAGGPGSASLYDVPKGEVWLKNEAERFRFELSTPALTAAIRGTEFVVRVGPDGLTSVALLGGALTLFNAQGQIPLAAGEIGSARPGQAPTKQVLVNPRDAVQWTLYYPAVADPAMLLSGAPDGPRATAARLALGQAAHGDVAGAYAAASRLAASGQAGAGELTAAAYVALMAGEPGTAGTWLAEASARDPGSVAAASLTAQMALFENRREEARAQADALLARAPDSALAQVTAGLAAMAAFDLPRAKAAFARALVLDPGFVAAAVYLARIELGSDELEAAWATISKALAAAPGEAVVQATAGFVRLGFRDFKGAEAFFNKAAALDPGLGDARLGLGYVAYSRGQKALGLEQMLGATLLSPRLSLLQSALGKALYQNRDFDKALATYDYAASLDPRDPTPHLYKGIALTDLNRPGEAVMEINRSIAKNGNQALFRSRLTLDRDLAVRNVDLARSYTLLGLGDWAYSKAVTAVKNDPLNPSAHLFMSSAYTATRQRVGASGTELLLYRLLSPANQNSFTLYNDYTPMFEMPYLRFQTVDSAGVWSNGKPIWSASLEAYGGRPGLAGDVYGSYSDDQGMREQNGDTRSLYAFGQLKWEPTVRNAVLAVVTTNDTHAGDTANQSDWLYPNSPFQRQYFANRTAELGYVHRFGPAATFIGYAAMADNTWVWRDRTYAFYNLTDNDVPASESYLQNRHTNRRFVSLQAQQQLILGDHTLLVGADHFGGELDYLRKSRDFYVYYARILNDVSANYHYNPADRAGSVYAMDYWQLAPGLVAEIGLGYDAVASSRFGWPDPIERQLVSPRFGLNWQMTADHTLRLAFQRYLNTHTLFQSVIQPSEVAGFPGRLNADDASQITEFGAAWEAQWDEKTFTVARAAYHRVQNPQYDPYASYDREIDATVSRYMVTLGLNRILLPSLGLSAFGVAKRLLPDESTARRNPEEDFFEADGILAVNYLHPSGFGAGISGTAVHQFYFDNRYQNIYGERRTETLFGLLGAQVSYQFPGKRGFVSVAGTNLTGTRFTYQHEAVTLDSFYPDRQILFKIGWFF